MPKMLSDALDARGGNLRDVQKAETRERVVEAARALFQEKGYEGATIRDIARRAEVAPGSVFTTFETKADLLQEIVFRRLDELFAAVEDAVRDQPNVLAGFTSLAHAAYSQEVKELRLLADNIGASWTWSEQAELENRRRIGPLFKIMAGLVDAGIKRGELRADVDKVLLIEAIFSCYIRIFRKGIFDSWDAPRMADYLAAQVALILTGARKG
jgi:AcrR family transcriptional regulator